MDYLPMHDLKALIAEAEKEVRRPAPIRCWLWIHSWTGWTHDESCLVQTRRCLSCGLLQRKVYKCEHPVWETFDQNQIMNQHNKAIGMVYRQQCQDCGEIRHQRVM